jgi:hypothetical protein
MSRKNNVFSTRDSSTENKVNKEKILDPINLINSIAPTI